MACSSKWPGLGKCKCFWNFANKIMVPLEKVFGLRLLPLLRVLLKPKRSSSIYFMCLIRKANVRTKHEIHGEHLRKASKWKKIIENYFKFRENLRLYSKPLKIYQRWLLTVFLLVFFFFFTWFNLYRIIPLQPNSSLKHSMKKSNRRRLWWQPRAPIFILLM